MFSLFLAISIVASPSDVSLEAVRTKKAAEEAAVAALLQRETSVIDALSASDAAVSQAELRAQRAENDAREAASGLAASEYSLQGARSDLEAAQGKVRPMLALHRRLNALSSKWALWFGLLNLPLTTLIKERAMLDHLAARDVKELGRASQASQRVREEVQRLRVKAQQLEHASLLAQQTRAAAHTQRRSRGTLLASIRGERGLREKLAREMEVEERRLLALVETLPRQASPVSSNMAIHRGHIPWPVRGVLEQKFGTLVNPKWSTVTIQKGLDIRAPEGTPVYSIAPGTVVHAGWFRGYGNLVIVDHGKGFHSLAAHLRSMNAAMGEVVTEGMQLGTVGDSGSLKGPYLYFEIREQGRPVDPLPWLLP